MILKDDTSYYIPISSRLWLRFDNMITEETEDRVWDNYRLTLPNSDKTIVKLMEHELYELYCAFRHIGM